MYIDIRLNLLELTANYFCGRSGTFVITELFATLIVISMNIVATTLSSPLSLSKIMELNL